MSHNEVRKILKEHALWLVAWNRGKQANFADGNVSDFDFSKQDLRCVSFNNAYIVGSNFTKANLSGCDLSKASFEDCILKNTNLKAATLYETDFLRCQTDGWKLGITVMPTPNIRELILEQLTIEGNELNLQVWHCGTAHCIAGWLVYLHPQGLKLEAVTSTEFAAKLILSSSGIEVPDFYTHDTAEAMAWLNGGSDE